MDEIHIGSIEKRLTGVRCPHCGRPADGGTNFDDTRVSRMPKPGDFAVCLYCGSLLCYTETLKLRRLERKERRQMQRDPRLAHLVSIAAEFAALKRKEWQ